MNIRIYLRQPPNEVAPVTLKDVDYARYEAANENNGKPDMLCVYKNVMKRDGGSTWEESHVVAEFATSDVVGHAEVPSIVTSPESE